MPEDDAEIWGVVKICEYWKKTWKIQDNYRIVIPKGFTDGREQNYIKNRELYIKLVKKEAGLFKDKNSKRIIAGGVSDGGFMSLLVFAQYCRDGNQLGGVFCLNSTFAIPKRDYTPDEIASIRETPLFIYIGAKHKHYPLEVVKDSFKFLRKVYSGGPDHLL